MAAVYLKPGKQSVKILEALGLRSTHVLALEIKVAGDEIATATVTYALEGGELREAIRLLVDDIPG